MNAPDALEAAHAYCAALAREHARDEWLGSLYVEPQRRAALLALTAFAFELEQAASRARDPNLVAIRLAWRREALRGERADEAAGDPVTRVLRAAIRDYALPLADLEAMIDARLQALAPQDDFTLHAFEHFADESAGAYLRLAARIAAGGRDLDESQAHLPAGTARALARILIDLPAKAGAAPTLFPVDVAERNRASLAEFDGRRASSGVVAACAEMRALAREKLADAERRLKGAPRENRPAFAPLGALRLDLDALDRASGNPFEPIRQPSPLRRQWAIWRWMRRR